MGILNWFKKKPEKQQKPSIDQDHNLIKGLELLQQDSNQCIREFILFLENTPENLILKQLITLDNTLVSDGNPEINEKFWKELSKKFKKIETLLEILKASWSQSVFAGDALSLAQYLEIYLKIDWDDGREWCSDPKSNQIIGEYVQINPNNTNVKCLLIFGINNIERLSPMIFPLLMYVADIPNSSLAPQLLQLVEMKLASNASEYEKEEIKDLINQILKSVRKEIMTEHVEYTRKAVDIYNKNNILSKLWRP